ncbi:MAG: N-acetylneuraminate synthase family protein [Verrucomicrobiota bacterium]
MKKPFLIAEIGCNHKGDMAIAKELIDKAVFFCSADAVKFQKRNPKELLSSDQYNAPHPNPANSYGETYGAHREFLELTVDQHLELKEHCEERGIVYSTSVWDMTSAKEITSLDPKFIKIPSATNLNFHILDYLCGEYGGEIQLSVGMTTQEEEEKIVSKFESYGRADDLVVFSCTSGYPVAFEDICLLEITRLKEKFGSRVKKIGFSGHHLGIAADIAALALGAEVFERHYTLDRTWKGTDHAASLEPDGMRRLARDLRNVSKALSRKTEDILPIELVQRKKLKEI